MCGRYVIYGPAGRGERGGSAPRLDPNPFAEFDRFLAGMAPRTDVRPSERVPIVRSATEPVQTVEWWLIPPYAKDPVQFRRQYTTFNARIETVTTSRLYGPLWRAGQRCLLPMRGWYEWRPIAGTKKKQRYYLAPADGGWLFAAGLWSHWQDAAGEGESLDSCTMIVTDASPDIAAIHDRSPLLVSADCAADWLTVPVERAMPLLLAQPHSPIAATPVAGPIAPPSPPDAKPADE